MHLRWKKRSPKKLHKHIASLGLDCKLLPDGTMDFEYDYPRSSLEGPNPGIASRGVMKVNDSVDYIDILKRKTVTKSEFAPGGMVGMGIAEGTTWKMRYFISFPPEDPDWTAKYRNADKSPKGQIQFEG